MKFDFVLSIIMLNLLSIFFVLSMIFIIIIYFARERTVIINSKMQNNPKLWKIHKAAEIFGNSTKINTLLFHWPNSDPDFYETHNCRFKPQLQSSSNLKPYIRNFRCNSSFLFIVIWEMKTIVIKNVIKKCLKYSKYFNF